MSLLRHGPHFAVHILSQLENVLGVRAAKIVGLIENLHPHRVIAWFLDRGVFRGCCHSCFSSRTEVRPDQLTACSSEMDSICPSIFSTRPRISSRSLQPHHLSAQAV